MGSIAGLLSIHVSCCHKTIIVLSINGRDPIAKFRAMDAEAILCEEFAAARQSLRVSLVTETYPPEVNGVAMTIRRMVEGLNLRGHHVQLVRPRQGAKDQAESNPNLEQILQPGLPIPRYDSLRMGLPAKSAMVKLWLTRRPDIVHIATEGPLGWSALNAARKLKLPVTTDFHTNFHAYSSHYGIGWLRKPIMTYLRKFHNRASHTFVPTQQMLNELTAQGYEKLLVVARGVDTRLFSPVKRSAALRANWGVSEGDPVVLYVGRIAPEKNLELVVKTFLAMRECAPKARLVLVGDGPLAAELKERHGEFIFAGMRTGEELAAHYASGDIFLFPSMTETFGNVTLEAMASGNAVIAYDYAAAEEHIHHNQNGLLAGFGDAGSFITQGVGLIADPLRIQTLGRQARMSVEPVDWESIHDLFESLLLKTVNSYQQPEVQ
jgi:glycosyltransferase involved in cell wall biosynthesis